MTSIFGRNFLICPKPHERKMRGFQDVHYFVSIFIQQVYLYGVPNNAYKVILCMDVLTRHYYGYEYKREIFLYTKSVG